MTTSRKAQRRQERRKRLALAAGAAGIALTLGVGTGSAFALWRDAVTTSAQLQPASSSFAYAWDGTTARSTVNAAGTGAASLAMSSAAIGTLIQSRAVAVELNAWIVSEGSQQIDYAASLGMPAGHPLAKYASFSLRDSTGGTCTAPAAPTTPWDGKAAALPAALTGLGGDSNTIDATASSVCVTITLPTTIESPGTYRNIGTVTGSYQGETFTDSDEWTGAVQAAPTNWLDVLRGDADGDGTPNSTDADIDGDGTPNSTDADIDGDGTPNSADPTPNGHTSTVPGAIELRLDADRAAVSTCARKD